MVIERQQESLAATNEAVYQFEQHAEHAGPTNPSHKAWMSMVASTKEQAQGQESRLEGYIGLQKELYKNGLESDLEEWLTKITG
jgi:hypothetical protein|tara:strand:- start:142 stop:393 length:252 start_codon:yes stop_codon:yes gene_type:complete